MSSGVPTIGMDPGVDFPAEPAGPIPGEAAPEPAPPGSPPPVGGDLAKLSESLGGSPIEAAMLLEHRDLQNQRRAAREDRTARREQFLAEAKAAHRERVEAAADKRASALFGACVSAVGLVGSNERLEASAETAGKLDGAFGFGASAERHEIAAEERQFRSDHAAKLEGEAADREQALREAQSKVLDLLQDAMRGQSESRAAATKA